jgi:cytochrome c
LRISSAFPFLTLHNFVFLGNSKQLKMKKFIVLAIAIVAFSSCKQKEEGTTDKEGINKEVAAADDFSPAEVGKIIFEGKGNCIACHKIYKEKNGNMISFLRGESEAIVDPSQYEIMAANLALTKTFTDTELQAIEAYTYSTLK